MDVAVSACLLGSKCRYDGGSRPCAAVMALRECHTVVPICPEHLAGLAVPHDPSEIDAGKPYPCVVGSHGEDRTDAFLDGAQRALGIVREHGCKLAILKSKSPSCGVGKVYDGTFSGHLVNGNGIATRLLIEAGIRVMDEVAFQRCSPAVLATCASETPSLETDRLVLRPMTEADAGDVLAYASDPEVGPRAGWYPHRGIEDSLEFIRTFGSAPHVFGIVEKGLGRMVGSIGFKKDVSRENPSCLELGYALGRPWWGRGYMTEAAREVLRYAFCDLGLQMVSINRYPDNVRSARVIEKCGFTYEGTLRATAVTPDGIMRDTLRYSMDSGEYFERYVPGVQ